MTTETGPAPASKPASPPQTFLSKVSTAFEQLMRLCNSDVARSKAEIQATVKSVGALFKTPHDPRRVGRDQFQERDTEDAMLISLCSYFQYLLSTHLDDAEVILFVINTFCAHNPVVARSDCVAADALAARAVRGQRDRRDLHAALHRLRQPRWLVPARGRSATWTARRVGSRHRFAVHVAAGGQHAAELVAPQLDPVDADRLADADDARRRQWRHALAWRDEPRDGGDQQRAGAARAHVARPAVADLADDVAAIDAARHARAVARLVAGQRAVSRHARRRSGRVFATAVGEPDELDELISDGEPARLAQHAPAAALARPAVGALAVRNADGVARRHAAWFTAHVA